ncbi:unnamed protein product [Rotaria sordida]|uniref:Uncharacterized protein n=1 Tax=Rotaria sordida TaxID=392033 RepID=A0A814HV99_9BILA|nr:unnamed protein product [Rotaria sordida]CAF1172113.1 unnamed protein product [Rotaria sordida]
MLSTSSSNNNDNDSNIVDLLYHLCKENKIEQVRSILPCIGNINIINKTQNSTTGNPEDQIICQQIETIEAYFKEAIEKQDYLTYFIKAYTLTN